MHLNYVKILIILEFLFGHVEGDDYYGKSLMFEKVSKHYMFVKLKFKK